MSYLSFRDLISLLTFVARVVNGGEEARDSEARKRFLDAAAERIFDVTREGNWKCLALSLR